MYEPIAIAYMGIFFLFFFVGMAFLIAVTPSKSRKYREELSNLYVAGRIRQLAVEDKIDLKNEESLFKDYCHKQRIREQSLDETIETELQEKIAKRKESKK